MIDFLILYQVHLIARGLKQVLTIILLVIEWPNDKQLL